jgi:hypothetical protein
MNDDVFSAIKESVTKFQLSEFHNADDWRSFFDDCINLLNHPEESTKTYAIDRLQKAVWAEKMQEYRQPGFRAPSAEQRLIPILDAIAKQNDKELCLLSFAKWVSLSDDQKTTLSRWLNSAESDGIFSADCVSTIKIYSEMFSVRDWNDAKSFLEPFFCHPNDLLRAAAAEAFGKMYLDGVENVPAVREIFDQVKNWEIERPGFAGSFLGQISMSSDVIRELEGSGLTFTNWILEIIAKRRCDEPCIPFHNGIDYYAHEILSCNPLAIRKLMDLGAVPVAAMAATEENYPIPGMQELLEELACSSDEFVARICSWQLANNYRYLHPEGLKRGYVQLAERKDVVIFLVFDPADIADRPYAATIYPLGNNLSNDLAWMWIDKLIPIDSRPRMEDNEWPYKTPQIESGNAMYVYGWHIVDLFGDTDRKLWERVWVKWPLHSTEW